MLSPGSLPGQPDPSPPVFQHTGQPALDEDTTTPVWGGAARWGGGDESAHWASGLPSGMANGKRELLACPFRQHGKGFSFFKLSFLSLLMGGHSPYKQTGGENWWENPAICTNRTGPQVCCGLLLSSLVSVGVPPSEL